MSNTILENTSTAVQTQREIRMYGVTEAGMREAVEQRLRRTTPAMMAASIMSDAQEMLSSDTDGSYDFMAVEDVRQALNRAKWILFEYCDTRG
jgi:hypothetical protein